MNPCSCFATIAAILIFADAGFAQEYRYSFRNPNLPIEAQQAGHSFASIASM